MTNSEEKTYKCCICGAVYTNKDAAVKCVNRCGRKMHQKGVFQTKEAPYGGETTDIVYNFECDTDALRETCECLMVELSKCPLVPTAFARNIETQLSKWNELDDVQKISVHDMLKKFLGRD